ncbi:MAG: PLP-dependent cysteine synthase family protein [Thermoprotei archaeon]|mgnify:CR=1 FL=1|nr:MAG: PLP-dependent cysteine synthase family protein [Thermoprotei archaeon]RLG81813.1 MAG: PLP-dependent cysteine synthase family protein [Thermoprotei archaeon]
MQLAEADTVKCEPEPLNKALAMLRPLLSKWRTKPVLVNDKMEAIGNSSVCYALKVLGTKYIPVSRDESEREVPLDLLDPYWEFRENTSRARVFDNVVKLLYGNWPTPIVKLKSLSNKSTTVWAKLEWYNPFSLSVKDRIAWYMLVKAFEEYGEKLRVVYEATSTNTGLALAGLANYYGIKTKLYLPRTAQKCVDYLFKALGASVVRKQASITTEVIDEVKEEALRDNAVNLNQFENDYNFYVHFRYTAKEIDYQSRMAGFTPDAIVGGIGTSGHLSAISFYFKSKYGDSVKIFAVEPKQGASIPGIRRVETGMKWIHHVAVDKVLEVSLEEAVQGVLRVAGEDGLLIGLSAGAVAYTTHKLVSEGAIEGDVVVVFPDHGTKYMEMLEGVLSEESREQ